MGVDLISIMMRAATTGRSALVGCNMIRRALCNLAAAQATPAYHPRFAGRTPVGSPLTVTQTKQGVEHNRLTADTASNTMVIGAACSEVFSGPVLHSILKPGFDYETQVMQRLEAGDAAPPLSIHTSAGTPSALGNFVNAIEPHLPWREPEDWFMSLQIEGASAVLAACDLLIQLQHTKNCPAKTKVAVGMNSYHGPGVTSFGSATPLDSQLKPDQLKYPVPSQFGRHKGESDEAYNGRLIGEFTQFLDEHEDELGVMLMEPQWGSSLAALPWPKDLLKQYITLAQDRGVLVCCDEIMCGLGRHGNHDLFLSGAWDLNPDAVTFGKAIGAGVFPLSGVVMRRGAQLLASESKTVMQMHTYAGSSVRALMAGTAVLEEIPKYYGHAATVGQLFSRVFGELAQQSGGGMECQGQGLMWGGVFTHSDPAERARANALLKVACQKEGVWPYFVPVGGFMVTPVMDITEEQALEAATRLSKAVLQVLEEVAWPQAELGLGPRT